MRTAPRAQAAGLAQVSPAVSWPCRVALRVTPRAITALVDGLVETGFVTREPCPADRRATLVTFTELGRTTTQAMADGHRELARQLFAGLPAETFDGFDAGLSHVIDRLRALLSEAPHVGTGV